MQITQEARDILQKFTDFKSAADSRYFSNVSEDIEFGKALKQWTPEQAAVLESRGQAPLVIPIIGPQIELQKSMIISKSPKFKVVGTEDSDSKRAGVFNKLLTYLWYKNNGDMVIDDAVDNQLTVGKGYIYVYWDRMANDGRGCVMLDSEHPLNVIPDPNSRRRDEEDSECKFIWRTLTAEQAKNQFPQIADRIGQMVTEDERHYTGYNHSEEDIEIMDEVADTETLKVKYITELRKVQLKYYRVIYSDGKNQQEVEFSEEEYQKFVENWQRDPDAMAIYNSIQGVEEFYKQRIRSTYIVGSEIVFQEILPTSRYPLIPVPYEHLGNPYCISLTRKLKGLQLEKNKRRSLMIAHATASTNYRLLVERGSVMDKEELENEWARPGSIIEVNAGTMPPTPIAPTPLPNGLYQLEQMAQQDSYYVGGSYPFSHGDSAGSPDTYRATLAIDEYGGRRIGNIARNLYYALNVVGRVMIDYIQAYMNAPQVLRIINPNEEYDADSANIAINMPMDKVNPELLNNWIGDVSTGKYDVYIISGSMAPQNRFAELEMYKEFYAQGIIDDVEVLKKTDIFDREGVMQRKSMYSQMSQQIKSMEEMIKNLQQNNRQLEDQVRQKTLTVEQEKFKGDLDSKLLAMEEEHQKKLLQLEQALVDLKIAKQEVQLQKKKSSTSTKK